MAKYKLFKDLQGINNVGVIKDDTLAIPFVDDNTDYQEYLQFLADGGVPEPADE